MSGDDPAATARELAMGMWLLVLRDALERSLVMLAKSRGVKALDWLSEFENQLIRDAKGTVTEGIAIDREVALIDSAIDHLKFVFDSVRRQIASKPADDQ